MTFADVMWLHGMLTLLKTKARLCPGGKIYFPAGASPDVHRIAAICLEVAGAVCLRWQAVQSQTVPSAVEWFLKKQKGLNVCRDAAGETHGVTMTPRWLSFVLVWKSAWFVTMAAGWWLMGWILNSHMRHSKAVRFFQECFYKHLWPTVWAPFNMCEFAFNLFFLPNIPTSRHLASAQWGWFYKNVLY